MKSAIYLDEGNTQLVLTPENDWEKSILGMIQTAFPQTFLGGFYECAGGWIRHHGYEDQNNSLIFRIPKQVEIVKP